MTAWPLEFTAVYTAGKRTEPHERPFDGTPSSTSPAAARSPGTRKELGPDVPVHEVLPYVEKHLSDILE